MYRISFRFAFVTGATLLGLTACAEMPPDVSPHYVRVPVVSPNNPDKVKYVLVPEACLGHDPTATMVMGETLPPGCANAYNLLRMTERKQDVVKGRPLGKAPAVTTARAAQKYLDGNNGTAGANPPPESAASGEASDTVNSGKSPGKTVKPKD